MVTMPTCTCAQSISRVLLSATPWTVPHQAPLSEILQGIFPTHGSDPSLESFALAGGFFTSVPTWEAQPSNVRVINSASFLPLLRAWVPWPWCTSPLRGVGMTDPKYPGAGNCAGLWVRDRSGVSAAESCLTQWQRVVGAWHSERVNLCQLVLCPCFLTKQYSTFADSNIPLPRPPPRPRNQCSRGLSWSHSKSVFHHTLPAGDAKQAPPSLKQLRTLSHRCPKDARSRARGYSHTSCSNWPHLP